MSSMFVYAAHQQRHSLQLSRPNTYLVIIFEAQQHCIAIFGSVADVGVSGQDGQHMLLPSHMLRRNFAHTPAQAKTPVSMGMLRHNPKYMVSAGHSRVKVGQSTDIAGMSILHGVRLIPKCLVYEILACARHGGGWRRCCKDTNMGQSELPYTALPSYNHIRP